MISDEWPTSDDATYMLNIVSITLGPSNSPIMAPLGSRELQLFAAACCRNLWHLLDESSRRVVEALELLADSEASTVGHSSDVARRWIDVLHTMGTSRDLPQRADQAALLRDIAGDPWRQAGLCGGNHTSFRPICRACQRMRTPEVVALARAAYAHRGEAEIFHLADVKCREMRVTTGRLDVGRLAVLSDALEEAGCRSEPLLAHLRSPGPHVRGCWAVDAALGQPLGAEPVPPAGGE